MGTHAMGLGEKTRIKLDTRINDRIKEAVSSNHRVLFTLLGENDEIIPTIYNLINKNKNRKIHNTLWCYKEKSEINKKNKKTKNDKNIDKQGINLPGKIEYVYYSEVDKILGKTYEMVILNDINSLNANHIAKIIETVIGGGAIIFSCKNCESIHDLNTLKMDIHKGFINNNSKTYQPLFNKRMGNLMAEYGLIIDSSFNLLNTGIMGGITKEIGREISEEGNRDDTSDSDSNSPITGSRDIGSSSENNQHPGLLTILEKLSTTEDQTKVITSIMSTIIPATGYSSVSVITSPRGRGKSSSLGILAALLCTDTSSSRVVHRIAITAPHITNLSTLFGFIMKTLNGLGYIENIHYSTDIDPKTKQITKVTILSNNNEISYVHPDHSNPSEASVLFIDEAAAIPLSIVSSLIHRSRSIVLSSTISGYEGTGRSLSLKLIADLKKKSRYRINELSMNTPIRYGKHDPIEHWLNRLLCLDVLSHLEKPPKGVPSLSKCQLYHLNKELLFSGHSVSERMLEKIVSISVDSHYRNSPNDIQLLADSPDHHLYVLLEGLDDLNGELPEILCVIQGVTEGIGGDMDWDCRVSGHSGDLIPYTITRNYGEEYYRDFSTCVGIRIVRVSVNKNYQRMGYGSYAIEELEKGLKKSSDKDGDRSSDNGLDETNKNEKANKDNNTPNKDNRDESGILLQKLNISTQISWIGASFGVTRDLLKFWRKGGYVSVYLRGNPSPVTGEHSLIVMKDILGRSSDMIDRAMVDFKHRLIELYSSSLRNIPIDASLLLMNNKEITLELNEKDIERIREYVKGMIKINNVMDAIGRLIKLFFSNQKENSRIHLSHVSYAVIIGVGLQKKSIESISKELNLHEGQTLSIINKTMGKLLNILD
eukprot:GHVP01038429.1.p1 GENE.GHVP01038429.1~~GHVP01038429.1.p1  ORF type:complete len:880 (+),score=108.69 GHVP01038429.1:172-2811(+)